MTPLFFYYCLKKMMQTIIFPLFKYFKLNPPEMD